MRRITVAEAAMRLGVSQQAVRRNMANGTLQIGFVIGNKRKTYTVFEELVKGVINGNVE